ncbi:MAG: T9SS C-terminal target domain-containing protein, partial [Bacteroidota bacterium]
MKAKHIFIAGLSILLSVTLSAKEIEGKSANSPGKPSAGVAKAADCVPPTGYRQFELNNVRFGLETAGSLWENRPGGSIPDYEVPKGGDIHSLFAGGLWMGGTSPDQQLKLAAVTYRQSGTDFWPGPLTDETAEVEPETCEFYDRHWLISRQDVQVHRLWFERNRLVNEGLADESILSEDPFENGYTVPAYFFDYPAINFDPLAQRDLAPYFDYNGDDFYDPEDGDYPGYDIEGEIDCNAKCATDPIPLFGDETLWWVFNDKGSVHTEFGGDPIGMEVRAQAFAFTSNDEINNMTFCNYTLINRGTQTLINTYFGQWVDPDLGCFSDDYVGCDVQRGLGYCYNGDAEDENCSGANGYGGQPPAIGIDFFEGPFQDPDLRDNPDTTDIQVAILDEGIPYPGLGIGYGDGIGDPAFCADPACCDNERFGMRKFVYYNNDNNPVNGNPDIAIEVYNYLRGFWRNGQRMTWGGDGTNIGATPTDYMFPGDTDPLGWSTAGVELETGWTEEGVGNTPADRRFLQSAGPFILEPGEFNNITVGVVWARALSGGPLESVSELQRADDKAQSLFDNCFRILNGPDAPDVTIQELDNQLVLYLNNDNVLSNNFQESYTEFDPTIPDTYSDGGIVPEEEKFYEFQGYKIYQVSDASVSANDLDNPDAARLAFQCDIVDFTPEGEPISQIVNWEFDPTIGLVVPVERVNGANEGINHTFLVTQDLFSSEGVSTLVNHKKYYFIAVAYGYNNYEDYNYITQAGAALPYIESRRSASGDVKTVCGIPHIPAPEGNGTVVNAQYGDSFEVIRVEGEGNGGLTVDLNQETIDEIMSGEPWRADRLKYNQNAGPVNVKIVDPLNVTNARLQLAFFVPDTLIDTNDDDEGIDPDDTYWRLSNLTDPSIPAIESLVPIGQRNEQIVPEYGISVQVEQYNYPGGIAETLDSDVIFEDPDNFWLIGIPDIDGQTTYNWIKSGTVTDEDNPATPVNETIFNDYAGKDDGEVYERLLGGGVAPWYMTSRALYGPSSEVSTNNLTSAHSLTDHEDLSSVDIVLTSNKDLWTRVPVIEIEPESNLAEDQATKCELRGS